LAEYAVSLPTIPACILSELAAPDAPEINYSLESSYPDEFLPDEFSKKQFAT
jgi:hypothetical protein